jgi:hypothetical protein
MLKEVRLTMEKAAPVRALLAAIENARSGGKIYKTYVEYMGQNYILMTTSEDTHLELGLLSMQGLKSLCDVLDGHFNATDGELLLSVENEKDCKSRPVFITMSTRSDKERVYHLSPA